MFDDNFESGNVGRVTRVSSDEYHLELRSDTCNHRHRLWFYFRVRNARANQRVVFTVKNMSKNRSLYRDGMSPLVRSGRVGSKWERVPPRNVFYYRPALTNGSPFCGPTATSNAAASAQHADAGESSPSSTPQSKTSTTATATMHPTVVSADYHLSFCFTFARANEAYYFAYSYPFTYTTQQRILHALEAKRLPYMHRACLARSLQSRRVDVITLVDQKTLASATATSTSATQQQQQQQKLPYPAPAPPSNGLPTVVVSARVHPGETPASWAMKGLLDFLASDKDADARRLRQHVQVIVVPMLNPDGVFVGNYRCNSLGLDLNRCWAADGMDADPGIEALSQLLQWYASDPRFDLRLFLDLHAHSTSRCAFFLCNPPGQAQHCTASGATSSSMGVADASTSSADSAARFPRLLSDRSRMVSYTMSRYDTDPAKLGTGRRALTERVGARCECMTLELSFFGTEVDGAGLITEQSSRQPAPRPAAGMGGEVEPPTPPEASTDTGYATLGRCVGLALMDLFHVPTTDRVPERAPEAAFGRASVAPLAKGVASPRLLLCPLPFGDDASVMEPFLKDSPWSRHGVTAWNAPPRPDAGDADAASDDANDDEEEEEEEGGGHEDNGGDDDAVDELPRSEHSSSSILSDTRAVADSDDLPRDNDLDATTSSSASTSSAATEVRLGISGFMGAPTRRINPIDFQVRASAWATAHRSGMVRARAMSAGGSRRGAPGPILQRNEGGNDDRLPGIKVPNSERRAATAADSSSLRNTANSPSGLLLYRPPSPPKGFAKSSSWSPYAIATQSASTSKHGKSSASTTQATLRLHSKPSRSKKGTKANKLRPRAPYVPLSSSGGKGMRDPHGPPAALVGERVP